VAGGSEEVLKARVRSAWTKFRELARVVAYRGAESEWGKCI